MIQQKTEKISPKGILKGGHTLFALTHYFLLKNCVSDEFNNSFRATISPQAHARSEVIFVSLHVLLLELLPLNKSSHQALSGFPFTLFIFFSQYMYMINNQF